MHDATHDPTDEKSHKISILIADDHPLMRSALRSVLQKEADFEIIAEAADGEEAVKMAAQLAPQVAIIDISMPKMNGLDVTRQITEKCHKTAVLALTVHTDSEHVLGILEAGAIGYLTKSVFGKEVIQAVRTVASGETVIAPDVFQQILRSALRRPGKPLPLGPTERPSVRELQVLRLLATGMSNKDMADNLGLSVRTIKGCLGVLFSKLYANSRTELVTNALRLRLLSLDDPQ